MKRVKSRETKQCISIWLGGNLLERVLRIAELDHRKRSQVVALALEKGMEELEEEMERKFGRPITPQKIDHPEKTPVDSAVDAVEKAAVKVATRARGVS